MGITGLGGNTAPGLIGDIKMRPQVKPLEEQRDEEKKPAAPSAYDEYVPEEKPEPIGQYRLGQDEEGQPKIYFDKPDDSDSSDEASPAGRSGGKKAETITGSTDKVDREIRQLKKQRDALQQQINAETDEAKLKNLQSQLNQVEQELRQKDNDAYRRSHMEVTKS